MLFPREPGNYTYYDGKDMYSVEVIVVNGIFCIRWFYTDEYIPINEFTKGHSKSMWRKM